MLLKLYNNLFESVCKYRRRRVPVLHLKVSIPTWILTSEDRLKQSKLKTNIISTQGLPRLPTEYAEAHNVLGHRKLSLILFLI